MANALRPLSRNNYFEYDCNHVIIDMAAKNIAFDLFSETGIICYFMRGVHVMKFEWDEDKNELNKAKQHTENRAYCMPLL